MNFLFWHIMNIFWILQSILLMWFMPPTAPVLDSSTHKENCQIKYQMRCVWKHTERNKSAESIGWYYLGLRHFISPYHLQVNEVFLMLTKMLWIIFSKYIFLDLFFIVFKVYFIDYAITVVSLLFFPLYPLLPGTLLPSSIAHPCP